ncbi:MAG: NapC/NirT family cytochrome c [Thermoanaerobaculia bacterium]
MDRKRFPYLFYNLLTAVGAALLLVTLLTFLALWLLSLGDHGESNPYFGIFLYMVLPPFLILGLLLVPIGMYRKWRRWKREGAKPVEGRFPLIDFNRSTHRNAALVFLLASTVLIAVSAVGSYGAYHYSESVEFCGTTCHTVMEPEYTAYQSSPHARVSCAECHVGPGADWYVKSKLSGVYQIYAAAFDKYPRPIPTPIESLRPAQATCEQCHWPEKAFGAQQVQYRHSMYDEANTEWPISLLIKTGGGDPKSGQEEGIHWHMNIGVKVEYVPRDSQRQEIPWVKVTDLRTGRVTVYQDEEEPLSEEELAASTPRVMDCMDCHNRPSHIFRSPDLAIDNQLLVGRIDRRIPYIKKQAVKAISQEYETRDDAMRRIANDLTEYYRSEYPEFYSAERLVVDDAIVAVQEAYSKNVFPLMQTDWADYPDNIGHLESVGCMRCHDGGHVDEKGIPLTRDCNTCHIILSQGTGERFAMAGAEPGLRFDHPEDIDDLWEEMACHECHEGTQP